MKCVFCQNCGEAIPRGDHLFLVDSVFEESQKIVCSDCASAYKDGYPEAIKPISGDDYTNLHWVDVISDWRRRK